MNPAVSTQRRQVVERARDGWVRRLIDLSRRNNLLYYRDLKSGTLDLTGADRPALTDLWHGKTVPLTRLLPGADETKTAATVREIARRAQANLEEKGLETLFLTLGMATWPATDDGRPPEAAVLLCPVTVEMRGLGRSVALRRTGEIQVNLVLLHVLEVEHGCKVNPEWLLEVDLDGENDDHFDPTPVFERLTGEARAIKGFTINWRAVLGNFSFQKLAMVRDLRDRGEELAAHDLIAAIAGDGGAREQLRARGGEIAPQDLDRLAPEQEHLVLDADSSQHGVAATVLTGQSTVIQGPPGTGKSQTIANLIASLAAQGKRVLFVAEKRAALEVVQNRLEGAGLGHLALDLHGADLTRAEIMRRVRESLAQIRSAPPVDGEETLHRFSECRIRLNEHVRRLHQKRQPSGLSVYEMQGKLLRLAPDTQTPLRWRQGELERLDGPTARGIEDLLREAAGFPGLVLRDDPSPWTGAALPDGKAAQQAVDLVWRINTRWPGLSADLAALCTRAGLNAPPNLEAAAAAAALAHDLTRTLEYYSGELFAQDLTALETALAPAGKGGMGAFFAGLLNGAYKRALGTLRGLRRQGELIRPAQLFTELTAAADQQRRWKQLGQPGARPVADSGAAAVSDSLTALLADVRALAPLLNRPENLTKLDLPAFAERIEALALDQTTPQQIASVLTWEREVTEKGAGAIFAEIRRTKLRPKAWPLLFRHAWLSSCLDQARLEEPALASFKGRTHDQYVTEFRRLDRQRLKLAADRVRRRHAEHAVAAMNANPDQEALVRREAEKKSRHLPLRKLLAQAPDVLTALFPCWMASPLSVSQLMDADRKYFDVVMFDEASQVLPEDAVPSLLRGEQAVVAGDEHQLPPTIFFADGAGEEAEAAEEELSATAGFESLLKLTAAFLPQRMLQWHYRSRDEALIAFSNRHIYQDQLVTFPGSGGDPTVSHVLVAQEPGTEGQEDSSAAEVRRVVELILEHALTRPKESLGVIAMGIKHAQRVQAELDRRLAERIAVQPELAEFFDTTRLDRFFIKNLERVQGDERDVIILTVGYGKDRSGRLPYRFGPLLMEGGERRLNVAVTRAKRRMILVSSFSYLDMEPGRSKARGVELLRLYLEYAATRGHRLGDAGETGATPSEFVQEVYDALKAEGIPLKAQWGVSGYRIDLAAQHPGKPERFVLAIECDGPSYSSAPTARDRDRLRQQHLEALGWRFHRIWSTDWFLRRQEEIGRAAAAYKEAVDRADAAAAEARAATAATAALAVADAQSAHTTSAKAPAEAPADHEAESRRAPRPPVPVREKIDDYSRRELDALVRWIISDGQLRTDDQILDEMIPELGFKRRGPRIESAVREAIARTR